MLDIQNHLEMEDYQLSESRIHHSMSKCLIFSQMLCYGCIREPYNVQFQHNAQMVFYLSVHFRSL